MKKIFAFTWIVLAPNLVLHSQTNKKVEFYCPDDWEGDLAISYIKNSTDYFGIYLDDKQRQTSSVRRFNGKDSVVEGPYGKWRKILCDSISPTFVIRGIGLKRSSVIPGIHFNSQRIFPGQSFFLSLGEKYYVLYATGTPVLEQVLSNEKANPFSVIKDYKLILRSTDGKLVREQIIFNQDMRSWPAGGYEGGFLIKWMGDLDGDNTLDILLTNSNDFRSWDNILYMGVRDKDILLKEIARYTAGGE